MTTKTTQEKGLNMAYKHAKVRKNSQFIQVEACVNNVRYRFSTKLEITQANLEYVERNYKEIISKHTAEQQMQQNNDNPYTIANYGYKVLKAEEITCKESTFSRYYNVFKKHIVAQIGSMLIHECSPKVMKEVFATKLSDLSFSNRNVAIIVLKKIFNHAIDDEIYTKANPIACIKRGKNNSVVCKNKPFELHETMKIIEYAKHKIEDEKMQFYITIALFTGMRVNEILALKYEDIDLKNNTISVYKTLSNGKITSTKTQSGTREVEIIEALYPTMQLIKSERQIGYIFANHQNKFISKTRITKQFKEILVALSIQSRTLYSTRHTFASLSLSYGEDILWIARMLGHKDITTVCKNYAKYMKKDKKRAAFFNENYREVG